MTYLPRTRRAWSIVSASALLSALVVALTVVSCTRLRRQHATDPSMEPPPAPREFRAAWVATVANIDWPSKPGLPTEQQQREILAILDKAAELKLNAIILQVRTACDALYESKLEPWSEYLTGEQGRPPEPYYDPLKMWVDEAHKRGIELHAWFNPYRARHEGARTPDAPTHVANTRPEVVRKFGKWEWLDPAEEKASQHTLAVFLDVVKRYDVDGVHIDDYFYPYPSYLNNADFPDDGPWKRYQDSGGKLSRADWRRDNVNRLVKAIYDGVKRTKKHVKFGISPFGIWRPGHPQGIVGFDQHEKLYADAKLWLNEGWIDYYTPQLYWAIGSQGQSYPRLLDWWISQNAKGRHLWPGNSISRVGAQGANAWKAEETLNQIGETRKRAPAAAGNVFFSMKVLMADRGGLATALKEGPYAEPALVPASTWLDQAPPKAPELWIDAASAAGGEGGAPVARWKPVGGEEPWLWAVYVRHGATWKLRVLPRQVREMELAAGAALGPVTALAVAAVDRCGNESRRSVARP